MKKVYLFLPLLLLFACEQKENLVKKAADKIKMELASGKKHDSILLGFYFGMPQTNFYKRLFELKQSGKVWRGDDDLWHYILGQSNSKDLHPVSLQKSELYDR